MCWPDFRFKRDCGDGRGMPENLVVHEVGGRRIASSSTTYGDQAAKFYVLLVTSLALVFVAFIGCNRGEPLGKVFGTVTSSGEPLPAGSVVFSNSERGIHIMARLSGDGNYRLQTAKGIGLPLGDYQVSVCPPIAEPVMPGAPQAAAPPRVRIPEKFKRPETSGLKLTVREGENRFDISMK